MVVPTLPYVEKDLSDPWWFGWWAREPNGRCIHYRLTKWSAKRAARRWLREQLEAKPTPERQYISLD